MLSNVMDKRHDCKHTHLTSISTRLTCRKFIYCPSSPYLALGHFTSLQLISFRFAFFPLSSSLCHLFSIHLVFLSRVLASLGSQHLTLGSSYPASSLLISTQFTLSPFGYNFPLLFLPLVRFSCFLAPVSSSASPLDSSHLASSRSSHLPSAHTASPLYSSHLPSSRPSHLPSAYLLSTFSHLISSSSSSVV